MANNLYDFERDMLRLAASFQGGKETKKFLKKQGRKLNKEQRKQVTILTDKNTKKNIQKHLRDSKSFKTGKAYKYNSDDLNVRAYSSFPTAHLIDKGHIIRARGKNLKSGERNRRGQGREVGFVRGTNFMKKAQDNFESQNYEDTQKFLDEMLNKHGLS